MSDIDSEQEGNGDVTTEMMFIAERVQGFPAILEKSQIAAMKQKKTAALTEIVKEYVTLFGKEMEIKAFMKKVNNMKTRLKNKTDKNKTGNKSIGLLSWEKVILKAMDADVNAVLSRVPGALAIGVSVQPSLPISRDDIVTESDANQMTMSEVITNKMRSHTSLEEVAPKRINTKPTFVCGKPEESDETRLQRLVLLEQLKVARLQQQYLSAKLHKLELTVTCNT
ncbi:hypothetical protein QE152_g35878 [Popillia japonica]|uniref:Uncharacterized protein n=1 Tax=Popillia japonica TaxID=7064 RepID=A0AAW1IEJ9_POPJA